MKTSAARRRSQLAFGKKKPTLVSWCVVQPPPPPKQPGRKASTPTTVGLHLPLCASASVAVSEADVPMRERQQADTAPPPPPPHSLHPPIWLPFYPSNGKNTPPPPASASPVRTQPPLPASSPFVWAALTLISRQLQRITRGWRPAARSQQSEHKGHLTVIQRRLSI